MDISLVCRHSRTHTHITCCVRAILFLVDHSLRVSRPEAEVGSNCEGLQPRLPRFVHTSFLDFDFSDADWFFLTVGRLERLARISTHIFQANLHCPRHQPTSTCLRAGLCVGEFNCVCAAYDGGQFQQESFDVRCLGCTCSSGDPCS